MEEITKELGAWADGDDSALNRIAPLVYPKLRDLAGAFFRGERPGHTWQATAVVSELFIRLVSQRRHHYGSRRHFYNACARLMRHVLIDHARTVQAEKRGEGAVRVPLHPDLMWLDAGSPAVIDLDRALTELAGLDAEQAAMFETHYLLGCSVEETAELFETSKSSVDRQTRMARAWLYNRLTARPKANSASAARIPSEADGSGTSDAGGE
jgi:RNA polymerase sigma factor (TIGR02999 family)